MLDAIPFLATCGAVMNDLLAALRAEFIGRTQWASALRAKFSHVCYFTVGVSFEAPAGLSAGDFCNGVSWPAPDAGVWFNFSAPLIDHTYFFVVGLRLHSNTASVWPFLHAWPLTGFEFAVEVLG